ncbi:FAD-binding oxidoreductase [Paucibacter sp. APW11]|uniref:FAD-binding oxidoreductase n=1 Tax=Roseateles aquae TaxID=3077235 RepID=A0ABU3PCD8_9BURK|nr:FAD-binding oxidoreductase [Paucibacter sp. APW11]MDT9000240.1 FAD-binding oxidoreductase [Paucibacter sp. APW11]
MSTARSLLIIGGGAIGSAIAAKLAQRPDWQGRISVLERDASYAQASSALSAASIRQQFSTPLNIALSQYGLAWLRQHGQAAQLVEQGYLYLADSDAGAATLQRLHAIQRAHGADVLLLDRTALAQRWPWLRTQDLTLASWGRSGEGWFDGWALLQTLKQQAQAAGVQYLHDEALALERDVSGAISGVHTATGLLQADHYVLACGAWSGKLAATAGLHVPVSARRRSVYVLRSAETAPHCPLVIDPSGLWFRPEGEFGGQGQFLCGGPPLDDAPDLPLDPDPTLFEEQLWPALAARVPGFESLRLQRAWAGYYEMNDVDHNGLVGALDACPNLLLACGFSGHGLQHAPGVGRGVAEWLACGHYQTLDLSPLSPARIAAGRPYLELNVI